MNRLALLYVLATLLLQRPGGTAAFVQQQKHLSSGGPIPRVVARGNQQKQIVAHARVHYVATPLRAQEEGEGEKEGDGRTNANPDFFKPFLQKNFVLSPTEINPLVTLKVGSSDKLINAFGLWTLVVSLVTGPIWAAIMYLLNQAYEADTDNQYMNKWDPNRAIYDSTGKVWSRIWLALTLSTPTLSGDVDRLREGRGPCLYVANHASWLDIPVLCTVLDPVFKFIAKGELGKVPCIGQQLNGGKHIMINREDRKSQFLTFKEGLGWLKSGVPIMAFPEGQRSPDGRLIDFKGGIFSMAVKSKVPIVPISLSNTHAVMPGNSLFPVQPGAGKLHIHVHESIDTDGLSDVEIAARVRETLLSKMPDCQHPLDLPVVGEKKKEAEIEKVDEMNENATVAVTNGSASAHHGDPSAVVHAVTGAEITNAILKKDQEKIKAKKTVEMETRDEKQAV
mmetsp:Transcript_15146/g.30573  ORF Transcript_15146/g.30573 Transcript_15146/m.30573 type:complete len:451 (-) Transcript_15146:2726-4078(-)